MGLLVALAGAGLARSRSEDAREKSIQLTEVPQAARDAAKKPSYRPDRSQAGHGTNPQ